MTLPNFLIVGAAKSGTTSLYHYLGQHPEVYFPPVKEPHYFSENLSPVAYSEEEYEALFAGRTTEKVVGEASVTYLCDPGAPYRIQKLLGKVRIIIVLRNPADRMYSLWGHMYRLGYETLSFEQALAQEETRIESPTFRLNLPTYHGLYYYFHSGLYYEQVKRYLDVFGRDRVQIHIFEEFVRDSARTCKQVFSFLGVNPSFRPVFERQNVSAVSRVGFLHRFLVSPPSFLKRVYLALPMGLRIFVYRIGKSVYWWNQQQKSHSPLDRDLRSKYLGRYVDDIKQLENLCGKDLSIWYASLGEAGTDIETGGT